MARLKPLKAQNNAATPGRVQEKQGAFLVSLPAASTAALLRKAEHPRGQELLLWGSSGLWELSSHSYTTVTTPLSASWGFSNTDAAESSGKGLNPNKLLAPSLCVPAPPCLPASSCGCSQIIPASRPSEPTVGCLVASPAPGRECAFGHKVRQGTEELPSSVSCLSLFSCLENVCLTSCPVFQLFTVREQLCYHCGMK